MSIDARTLFLRCAAGPIPALFRELSAINCVGSRGRFESHCAIEKPCLIGELNRLSFIKRSNGDYTTFPSAIGR